jgi:hypothetical protein
VTPRRAHRCIAYRAALQFEVTFFGRGMAWRTERKVRARSGQADGVSAVCSDRSATVKNTAKTSR